MIDMMFPSFPPKRMILIENLGQMNKSIRNQYMVQSTELMVYPKETETVLFPFQ